MGKRYEQTQHTKDKWQISIWKDAAHHMSSRKCKLKHKIPLHAYQNGKNSKHRTPNAGEDAEQQELSFVAGGDVKRYSHFGRQFGSF